MEKKINQDEYLKESVESLRKEILKNYPLMTVAGHNDYLFNKDVIDFTIMFAKSDSVKSYYSQSINIKNTTNDSELAKYKELDECNKCTIHNLKQTVSDLKSAMIRGDELSKSLKFEGDGENNKEELIKALKEYNKLLSDELDDSASMAFVHGWRSKRVEKGNELRERISKLEQLI